MKKRTMIVVLSACCLMTACNTQQTKKTSDAVRVVTERVTTSDDVSVATTYVGEVEAASSTSVSFTGSGTLQKVMVSEGQHVNKGQVIAVMDDTRSRNALSTAEAQLHQAQDAYDRMKMLHDRNSLSEMDWVEVQSRLQQARNNYLTNKKAVEDCRLVAPCSGVIGDKMLESGMTALPAEPVCNILDINKVKVKISVPEKEILNISKSATITVEALGGKSYRSSGMEHSVTADAVSRTYEVRYVVDNRDGRLLPGMVCSLSTDASCSQNLSDAKSTFVSVPITAVQRGADGKMFVWTVKDSLAHRTIVAVGKAHGNRITLLDGIKEGDEVVTKGYQKLNEGKRCVTH